MHRYILCTVNTFHIPSYSVTVVCSVGLGSNSVAQVQGPKVLYAPEHLDWDKVPGHSLVQTVA